MNIIQRGIENKVSEIRKKYNIIKEIDFNTDINKEKSGYYAIDKKTGLLSFLFGESKDIFEYNGFFLSGDKYNTSSGEVIMGGKIEWSKQVFLERYFCESVFSEENVLFFKVNPRDFNENDNICINVVNDECFMIHKSVNLEQFMTYKNSDFFSEVCYFQMFIGKDKSAYSWRINRGKQYKPIYRSFKTKEGYNEFIVNSANGCILINGEKTNIYETSTCNSILKHITIQYTTDKKDNEIKIDKNSICVCKKSGYIYLNRLDLLEIKAEALKLISIDKGEVNYEVYSEKKGKWLSVNEAELSCDKLDIRIKMSLCDKISNLFIVTR